MAGAFRSGHGESYNYEDSTNSWSQSPAAAKKRAKKRAKRRQAPSLENADNKKPRQEPPFPEDNSEEQLQDADPSMLHLTQSRFDEFEISPLSIKALHSVLKYETMTVVQEATFPVILKGREVMAKARTGTGKTIAFLLPAIEVILKASGKMPWNSIQVVIVCPTRELAQQVAAEAKLLLTFHKNLGAQVVFGGTPIRREQTELSKSPCQILVGTPGRLVDHIQNTPDLARQLKSVKLFVLDEADHMLDMGFRESLDRIMEALPSQRQTLLFSATIPKEVHNIANIALKPGYEFIDTVGNDTQDTHAKVKQQCIVVPLENQLGAVYSVLKKHIQVEPHYKVLVFCTTARVTAFMCNLFKYLGLNSREIHSRKNQSQRNRVSDEFRQSKGGIVLFTSDVSARGVDYPDVSLVVQVGAPSDLEQYIHRLGRTGRAGKDGEGVLVLAPWEEYFFRKLQKLPIRQSPAPELSAQDEERILTTASKVDPQVRTMAYQAWIGYYNSLKGLRLDKVKLIDYANEFSSSIGFEEPPALLRSVVSKMHLLGVRGLRIA